MNAKYVEVTLERVRLVYQDASKILDTLQVGHKITATDLAQQLSIRHNIPQTIVYHLVQLLADGYPGIEKRRGAHGGWHRIAPV